MSPKRRLADDFVEASSNGKEEEEEETKETDDGSDSDGGEAAFRIEPIVPKLPKSRATKRSHSKNKRMKKDVSDSKEEEEEAQEQEKEREGDGAKEEEKEEKEQQEDEKEEDGLPPPSEKEKEKEKQMKPFQRVWSEDDEIVILKGMLDYTKNGHGDPYSDMSSFLDFVKASLHFNPDQSQLKHKIRRLKKKYENKARNAGAQDPTISNPHELKSFHLSKQIWGCITTFIDNATIPTSTNDRKKKKMNDTPNPNSTVDTDTPANYVGLEQLFKYSRDISGLGFLDCMDLQRFVALVGTSKAKELEKKWNNLLKLDFQVYHERIQLLQTQTKLILDVINES